MILVSTRGLYESVAATYQTTWEALVQHLRRCALSVEPTKEQVPLFNGCELIGGIRKENVKSVQLAILDYDRVTHEQLAHAVIRAQQFRGFAYTTHSHALDGLARFRVGLALDRPCPAENWDHVWHRLARLIGTFHPKAPDRATRDASRFFFQPAQNPAGPACWFADWDGPVLSLEELLKPDPIGGQEILIESELEQSERVGFSDVQQCAHRLAKKSDSTLQLLGRAMSAALRGEAYASDGYRNDISYKMAGELGKQFPRADAADLSEKFRASFELQGEPTCEAFAGMIRRQQLKHQQYEAERRAARQLRSVDEPVRAEGEPEPPKALPLVVQRGGHYWFRPWNSHNFARVYGKDDVALAFVRDFTGVVETVGPDNKTLPLKQQLDTFGAVALQVDATYLATENVFDPASQRLVLATAPRRPLLAEYSPQVAEWLSLLGGGACADVVAWIQALLDLDRPLQALYLWGPKGTGKSLLPYGLSRLWEHPLTDFATVVQSFNSGLSRNPLVLADEGFPKELTTTQLRSFLTTGTRSVNEKYRPHYDLKGFVRLVVTANNPTAFTFRGSLDHDDAEATSARVVQVHTPRASEHYLESLRDVRHWIEESVIARHALWLAQQPREACPGRWAMKPKGTAQDFEAGLVGASYAWFVAWLASYARLPREQEGRYTNPVHSWYIRTKAGRVLIAADAYRYAGERIEVHQFKKALAYFSTNEVVQLRVPDNPERRVRYFVLDGERFCASAGDYLDKEDFVNLISVDSEDRGVNNSHMLLTPHVRLVK